NQSCVMLRPGERFQRMTSRSASAYGSGRSSSACATLKTAVVAPIPRASDSAAVAANAGVLTKPRRAMRQSCSASRTPRCYHPPRMRTPSLRTTILLAAAVVAFALGAPSAQQIDQSFFSGLRWRSIGPPRSGYVSAPAGVPGDPNTYYVGLPEGG